MNMDCIGEAIFLMIGLAALLASMCFGLLAACLFGWAIVNRKTFVGWRQAFGDKVALWALAGLWGSFFGVAFVGLSVLSLLSPENTDLCTTVEQRPEKFGETK
jgi:hypothetical protein